ncbi:unnamed protein product [Penicillium pancosmium]
MERLDNIDLKKLKNYQCPVRRICVQTGHLRKLNFEEANQIHSVTYPKEVLTRLMGLSHLGALEYATAFRSEEKSVEITWLMLTRHDVERHLKTEKNPKVLFKAVESSHDSFFKMLVSRGATLNSEGWTKIAILENHLMTNSSRAFGEEALEYAASSEKELLFDSILNLEILPTDGQLHRAAKKGHYCTVKLLLDRGAAIDEKNDYGHTPLREAAATGQKSVVKFLLLRGAAVDVKDMDEKQALPPANQNGAPRRHVQLLRDTLAELNGEELEMRASAMRILKDTRPYLRAT